MTRKTALDRRRQRSLRYANLLSRASLWTFVPELAGPRTPAAHRPSGRAARMLVRRVRGIAREMPSATSPHEQLTLIRELLLVEPTISGVAVECGSWKGASTAALSLAAQQCDRTLHVFDTFTGLPAVAPGDERHVLLDRPEIHSYAAGMFSGTLDEVQASVARHGVPEVCHWHPGRVEETLPDFEEPVVLAFLDLDLREAVEAAVSALWPRLVPGCPLFVHEAQHHEIASLFYDNHWWRENLGCDAPGLAGAGSGIGLEPMDGFWRSSLGFARKDPAIPSYYVRPPVDVVGEI